MSKCEPFETLPTSVGVLGSMSATTLKRKGSETTARRGTPVTQTGGDVQFLLPKDYPSNGVKTPNAEAKAKRVAATAQSLASRETSAEPDRAKNFGASTRSHGRTRAPFLPSSTSQRVATFGRASVV